MYVFVKQMLSKIHILGVPHMIWFKNYYSNVYCITVFGSIEILKFKTSYLRDNFWYGSGRPHPSSS